MKNVLIALGFALILYPVSNASAACVDFSGDFEATSNELKGALLSMKQTGCESIDYDFKYENLGSSGSFRIDGIFREINPGTIAEAHWESEKMVATVLEIGAGFTSTIRTSTLDANGTLIITNVFRDKQGMELGRSLETYHRR